MVFDGITVFERRPDKAPDITAYGVAAARS